MVRYLRKSPSVAALAFAGAFTAALLATPGAQATVVFTEGNNPQPDEENVQFETDQTGMTITGATNQSNTPVQFTSTQVLTTGGIGQAFLRATVVNGPITGEVTFSVPGFAFKDYIFDPTVTGPNAEGGPARITAVSNDGEFTQNIQLDNGNNFWTLTTSPDEVIFSVTLTPLGNTDYATYRQPRVSGICILGEEDCVPVTTVPEPASLAILGSALLGFGLLRRRKRG
jgi:PEP-CTERM motif